jgi:hypothetical protein
MSHTLMSLDAEWRQLADPAAPSGAEAVVDRSPRTARAADLDGLLEQRRDDHAAPAILRALAVLAPGDDLAARTLLQALLPGLVRLAGMPATTTRPRSRRWCRWPGNASAPTRPGAGGRWPPTSCSTCASATAPIASSTHARCPTPRQ